MALSHNPRIVTDSLVLCLDAANPKSYSGSGSSWFDLSGNNNNGTLVNGVGYTNQNLGSLVFDGVDDEVNCGNSSLLKPNFITVESWIKHTNSSQSLSFICGVGNTGPLGYWLAFRPSSNALRFSLRTVDGTGAQFTTSSLSFPITNTIGHFVGTYDGVEVKMYYNGELVFTDTASGNIEYSSIENKSFEVGDLGYGGNTSTRFWTGNIYGVKIYNRALLEFEIKQNFNSLRGRYGI